MSNCANNFTDPHCVCPVKGSLALTSTYKQFDANGSAKGIGYRCCNILHLKPSLLADNSVGAINSNVDYLQAINNNDAKIMITNDVLFY